MGYNIEAAIFDLDGVITHTATQHARAWKRAFDEYNQNRKKEGKGTFADFSIAEDYPKYIDGIPRYDGVENFLKSRNIQLPYGAPKDAPGKETICGLGNLKNSIFLDLIKKEGVEVIAENIEQIKNWRRQGLKTAIISSSKNCKQILETTGLEDLFQVRLDGIVAQERNIVGKPAPDIFLQAAQALKVTPENTMIVEDSLAGIEAGARGNFQLVVAIANHSNRKKLLEKGADEVVKNLKEVDMNLKIARSPADLPAALEHMDQLKEKFSRRKPLFFLDFDGTLAPIVEHHDDAGISTEMRALVQQLAEKYPTAIISGRGMADVKKRVNLPGLFYAGSHGFEISGPNNFFREVEEAQEILPVFDEIEPLLKKKLKDIKGVNFERKKFTLAIHYRQVKEDRVDEVHQLVGEVLKGHPQVKNADGKKVIEIRPALDWHKGKAVETLKQELGEKEQNFSVYLGDDVTDEDAFEYVKNGMGILVGNHGGTTFADYHLKDIDAVKVFFKKLLEK